MYEPIGRHLDNPGDFFRWFSKTISTLTVLHTSARAGFLDQLGEGESTVRELSEGCGIPAHQLRRLLHFLAAEDIIELRPDDTVKGSPRSALLCSLKAPMGHIRVSMEAGFPLEEALKKGITSYECRFGKPVFEHLADNPAMANQFSQFMSFLTSFVLDFVFSEHTFKPFNVAVDVGGSHGDFLHRLLQAHPESRGILFDLPEVAAMVNDQIKGLPGGDRVEVVGGSFFNEVPAADLYLLKMILHDWNDDECIAILNNIRRVIDPAGRVVIVEHVMPETPVPHPANAMDIGMLVWVTGHERKLSEFTQLFEASGFVLDRMTDNPNGQCVLEITPV